MTTPSRPIENFRAMVGPKIDPDKFDHVQRRVSMERMVTRMPPPDDIMVEGVQIAGIACEWVTAPGTCDDRIIIWMHGGGFCAGSCFTHRGIAGEVARHTRARILTVDYRLSPEHPYPAANEDARAVYQAVVQMPGVTRLGVAGDSAGGALALGIAIDARDGGLRVPDALALLSPWLDLTCSAASYQSKAAADPMIDPVILRRIADFYLDGHPATDRRASPLFADLEGLPPILLQAGSDEVLLDDTLALDRKGRDAGVDVSLEVWSEMVHVFQAYGTLLPEASAALARVGSFFRDRWQAA